MSINFALAIIIRFPCSICFLCTWFDLSSLGYNPSCGPHLLHMSNCCIPCRRRRCNTYFLFVRYGNQNHATDCKGQYASEKTRKTMPKHTRISPPHLIRTPAHAIVVALFSSSKSKSQAARLIRSGPEFFDRFHVVRDSCPCNTYPFKIYRNPITGICS